MFYPSFHNQKINQTSWLFLRYTPRSEVHAEISERAERPKTKYSCLQRPTRKKRADDYHEKKERAEKSKAGFDV